MSLPIQKGSPVPFQLKSPGKPNRITPAARTGLEYPPTNGRFLKLLASFVRLKTQSRPFSPTNYPEDPYFFYILNFIMLISNAKNDHPCLYPDAWRKTRLTTTDTRPFPTAASKFSTWSEYRAFEGDRWRARNRFIPDDPDNGGHRSTRPQVSPQQRDRQDHHGEKHGVPGLGHQRHVQPP